MRDSQAPASIFEQIVVSIAHPKRAEDVIAEICLEILAGQRLENAPAPVDACAVEPLLARIEEQRARDMRLARTRFEVAHDGAREVVAKTSSVREHVPHCRRPLRGPQGVRPGSGVEGLEDFQVRQLRKILLRRIVEAEAALFDQLHHRQGRDRFCHRRNAENRVDGHRRAAGDICDPEGALIHDAAPIRGHRDHAGHISACHRGSEHLVDGRRRR